MELQHRVMVHRILSDSNNFQPFLKRKAPSCNIPPSFRVIPMNGRKAGALFSHPFTPIIPHTPGMTPQTFYDKYTSLMPQLYRTAYAIVGNRQDAEDAVQDTFVRMWEHRKQLEGVERPEAYFLMAVRNVCLNMLRARHEEIEVESQYALPDTADRTGQPPEGRSFIARLFSRLAPKARRIMTLRHVGEYSTRDIARLTGETESNVRSTLSRARQQLRDVAREISEQ